MGQDKLNELLDQLGIASKNIPDDEDESLDLLLSTLVERVLQLEEDLMK